MPHPAWLGPPCLSGALTGPTRVVGPRLTASFPHLFSPVLLLVPGTPGPGPLPLPWGPPSSPTPGKHLQFLLFCFLHGQLIIVDNVASLFSKSLVWILFFINYRNGFWHWNFVFDHQQGSGCEAAFLCACFTWITILFFFLRINSTETCSFSRRKRDLEVKVCIFKWLL